MPPSPVLDAQPHVHPHPQLQLQPPHFDRSQFACLPLKDRLMPFAAVMGPGPGPGPSASSLHLSGTLGMPARPGGGGPLGSLAQPLPLPHQRGPGSGPGQGPGQGPPAIDARVPLRDRLSNMLGSAGGPGPAQGPPSLTRTLSAPLTHALLPPTVPDATHAPRRSLKRGNSAPQLAMMGLEGLEGDCAAAGWAGGAADTDVLDGLPAHRRPRTGSVALAGGPGAAGLPAWANRALVTAGRGQPVFGAGGGGGGGGGGVADASAQELFDTVRCLLDDGAAPELAGTGVADATAASAASATASAAGEGAGRAGGHFAGGDADVAYLSSFSTLALGGLDMGMAMGYVGDVDALAFGGDLNAGLMVGDDLDDLVDFDVFDWMDSSEEASGSAGGNSGSGGDGKGGSGGRARGGGRRS